MDKDFFLKAGERESRKKGEDQRAEVGEMGERQRGIGQ